MTGVELKRAILDEARRALEEEGIGRLSTRRIAAAIGCTATSIYLYFENKDALVHALVAEGFAELNDRMLEAARAGQAPLERLRRGSHAFVDYALSNPAYYEIMFMLRFDQVNRFPAELYRDARRSLDAFAGVAELPPEVGLLRGTTLLAALHGLVTLILMKRVDAGLDQGQLIEHTIQSACAAALAEPRQ